MPRSGYNIICGLVLIGLCLTGCGTYKRNVMFKPSPDFEGRGVDPAMINAEKNYLIQPNDQLKLDVLSNKGERLVDPNSAITSSTGTVSAPPAEPIYKVELNGTVKFPMVGEIALAGKTIREAEAILETEFTKFYKESYVILTFANKRVIVLGSTTGQVIPLTNENVSLIEVLALAKGIGNDGKANNIRVIRGKEAYVVDLSTLESAVTSNMTILPGDIVYVEPIRRPFAEGLRDYAPFMSVIVSLATLIVVFTTNNQSSN
jgi:polysaccharide biosynthesis/export protein